MWTNEVPYEEGHYWVITSYYVNGELEDSYGPSMAYLEIKKDEDGNVTRVEEFGIGDDCPSDLFMTGDKLFHEAKNEPRDLPFMWQDDLTKKEILADRVDKRWEHLILKVEEPTLGDAARVYPETHQEGMISIEKDLKGGAYSGDLGIQIAADGRVWVCLDGCALIRFKPLTGCTLKKWRQITAEEPYLKKEVMECVRSYNPEYGDNRVCECGHKYERHFDGYDDMAAVGCKYCACYTFVEDQSS